MTVQVTFLGAAGMVTGSKYLVSSDQGQLLIDGGMFQGAKSLRRRNWSSPGLDFDRIRAVCLTHAHIDHTGILPRFVKLGLNCPIFATSGTADLSNLLLIDAGILQEEEADYRRKRGDSSHRPPLPLYRREDSEQTLKLFRTVELGKRVEVLPGVYAQWTGAGHILGAGSIRLEIEGKVITFSGDIGRFDDPVVGEPKGVEFGDLLLIESTYGNREHAATDITKRLVDEVEHIVKFKGVLLIPSFAVGRTQRVLYHLNELKMAKIIPDIPVFVDSPMAADATKIYLNHRDSLNPKLLEAFESGLRPLTPSNLKFVNSRQDSIRLNKFVGPGIVISASGMLSGGRVLHHLYHRLSSPYNSVLFVGYQPPGGKGAHLLSGGKTLRVFHEPVPVRARIGGVSGLSAHADLSELLRWCRTGKSEPKRVAVVHGEPKSTEDFSDTINRELGWNSSVAKLGNTWTL